MQKQDLNLHPGDSGLPLPISPTLLHLPLQLWSGRWQRAGERAWDEGLRSTLKAVISMSCSSKCNLWSDANPQHKDLTGTGNLAQPLILDSKGKLQSGCLVIQVCGFRSYWCQTSKQAVLPLTMIQDGGPKAWGASRVNVTLYYGQSTQVIILKTN